jgi:hypothetical protein
LRSGAPGGIRPLRRGANPAGYEGYTGQGRIYTHDPRFSFLTLARLEGFEPTTPGSEDRCSGPLSYRRMILLNLTLFLLKKH